MALRPTVGATKLSLRPAVGATKLASGRGDSMRDGRLKGSGPFAGMETRYCEFCSGAAYTAQVRKGSPRLGQPRRSEVFNQGFHATAGNVYLKERLQP